MTEDARTTTPGTTDIAAWAAGQAEAIRRDLAGWRTTPERELIGPVGMEMWKCGFTSAATHLSALDLLAAWGSNPGPGFPIEMVTAIKRPPAPQVSAETLKATLEILTERQRQIDVEGYTPKHDAGHQVGELASAAAAYALAACGDRPGAASCYPWHGTPFAGVLEVGRCLAASGALIVAALERLAAETANTPDGPGR